ncbi:hypothetical protein SAMN04488012_101322 [Palleronia salina]|uniref:Uncharacterized protein n=1 Tax=Palleronia salina TaxID=313368 RepID=A0A1M6B125_9RHOB|nr:hypothetical protein [Palleronia salina]SHI42439.1 hypothetical protein SAMN04488012_101322 [Palleronia salina]
MLTIYQSDYADCLSVRRATACERLKSSVYVPDSWPRRYPLAAVLPTVPAPDRAAGWPRLLRGCKASSDPFDVGPDPITVATTLNAALDQGQRARLFRARKLFDAALCDTLVGSDELAPYLSLLHHLLPLQRETLIFLLHPDPDATPPKFEEIASGFALRHARWDPRFNLNNINQEAA